MTPLPKLGLNNDAEKPWKLISSLFGIGVIIGVLATFGKVYWIIWGVAGVALLLVWIRDEIQIRKLRQEGIYPNKGVGTDADIRRLALSGKHLLAVRLHREIHGSDLRTAKAAVEAIRHP